MVSVSSLLSGMLQQRKEKQVTGAKYYWQDNCANWIKKLNIQDKDKAIMFKLFKRYEKNPIILESWCATAYELNAKNPIAYILFLMKKHNQEKKKNIS